MTHRLVQHPRWLMLPLLGLSCATGPQPAAPPAPPPPGPGGLTAAQPAPGAPTPEAPAPVAIQPPLTAWASMNFSDRRHYMKTVVMPKMKEVFTAYDASRYAKMTCTTCHGDGASEGSFRMPNPGLPRLPGTPEGFKKLAADKPGMTQFMLTKVKPTMARLLGVAEMTPENKTGFGCLNCHGK